MNLNGCLASTPRIGEGSTIMGLSPSRPQANGGRKMQLLCIDMIMKEGVKLLVPNQIIKTNWHPRNKEHLESCGYHYTHTGDSVEVKLEDMKHGSKCKVSVICDYCGEEYIKVYKDYFTQRENGKDCCRKCAKIKRSETNQVRYGGNSPFCSQEVQDKYHKAMQDKYGVCASTQLDWVKEKVKQTNMAKFGTPTPSQNPDIKEKARQVCIEKFGGPSSQCDPEIRKKTLSARLNKDNIPTSKQENAMVELLKEIYGEDNCHAQFLLDRILFDCLLEVDDIKIDVEYDGKYWHQEEQKDRRRDYFTISQGYKVIRFKSNYALPTKEQIIQAVDYLTTTDHHYIIIDLDNT